jgi:hypothetical protein
METHTLQVPASTEIRLLQFQMPFSDSFKVTGGSAQAMEATVATNVPALAPKASEDAHLRKYVQRLPAGRTLPDGARNTWDIRLGATTPLLLDITAGALKGDMSLGGLKLVGMNLGVGVDFPFIHFDSPNLTAMRDITVTAGAGDCRIAGLSHANVGRIKFTGGTGAVHLDFAGQLQQPSVAEIKGGVGDVTLVIPPTVPARLRVETGVGEIHAPGYAADGKTYTSPGFAEDKPFWEMAITVGAGEVTVKPQ